MKNPTRQKPTSGRGSKGEAPKRIDKLYYRGARLHHEIAARHTPKAVMSFRGKGSKVERRQKTRKKR